MNVKTPALCFAYRFPDIAEALFRKAMAFTAEFRAFSAYIRSGTQMWLCPEVFLSCSELRKTDAYFTMLYALNGMSAMHGSDFEGPKSMKKMQRRRELLR